MSDFAARVIRSWDEFDAAVREMTSHGHDARPWFYRGQCVDHPLSTTIERALKRWGIPLRDARDVEFQTIREFRRRLRDPEFHEIQGDVLHCLALMQHYGAPTRLLDCTYSPFVAAAFAMAEGLFGADGEKPQKPVIWCFNGQWCEAEAQQKLPADKRALVGGRNNDSLRNDETFIPLYQIKSDKSADPPRWKFVKNENPFHLNERLTAQQGAFLCPADLSSSFMDNIQSMDGWQSNEHLQKLCLELDADAARQFSRNLRNMNLSFAALFPGLDGFSRSINQQIFHYHELGQGGAGLG